MITRSPHWKEIREQAIKNSGGKCAACGLKTNLKVHHIIPLHIDKNMELDPNNLIVLCENKSIFCHYVWGHLMNWMSYNIDVVKDTDSYSQKKTNRP